MNYNENIDKIILQLEKINRRVINLNDDVVNLKKISKNSLLIDNEIIDEDSINKIDNNLNNISDVISKDIIPKLNKNKKV